VDKTVLITGVDGFVAKHCAVAFLDAGYQVRGSVLDPDWADAVRRTLETHADTSRLEFVTADLLTDTGWDAAVDGCAVIAHVASPDPLAQPRDPEDLIRPAVDGTLRVLRAARARGVRRVVHTSSTFAAYYGRPDHTGAFDTDDWSDLDGPDITPYARSKTLAERAARKFVAAEGGLEYVSLLPGYIFGPTLDTNLNASITLIKLLMDGKYPGAPRLCLPVVDARDVAEAHLIAAETKGIDGGRYLLVAESLWLIDLARELRSCAREHARKAPRWGLPDWMVRLVGLVDRPARSIVAELGRDVRFDTSASGRDLGIAFRPARDAICAAAQSLIDFSLV
jgi:dihydroflavonol-4-reductase